MNIKASIDEHIQLAQYLRDEMAESIQEIADIIVKALKSGNTIFWCGNGGSASDAQHLAAELVGRFNRDRAAYSSVALSSNVSTLTSIGNDYGFDNIFSRQVEGLGSKDDVLVAISTSGNSINIINAVESAKHIGMLTIGLSGKGGGQLATKCDKYIVIPSEDTARIQEMHIIIGHIICDYLENKHC